MASTVKCPGHQPAWYHELSIAFWGPWLDSYYPTSYSCRCSTPSPRCHLHHHYHPVARLGCPMAFPQQARPLPTRPQGLVPALAIPFLLPEAGRWVGSPGSKLGRCLRPGVGLSSWRRGEVSSWMDAKGRVCTTLGVGMWRGSRPPRTVLLLLLHLTQ